MPIRNLTDRALREYKRYTGDGLPNEPTGAALPIGDPASGVHNPSKADLRAAFGAAGDLIDAAVTDTETAQTAAESAAANAAATATRGIFATVTGLLADNNSLIGYTGSGASIIVSIGGIVEAEGFRYEVAASGATDHHLATAGGVKLYALAGEGGAISVTQCGALGDGSTDDTARLNAAIAAAGTGGSVFFPEGIYIFSDINTDTFGLIQLSGQTWFGTGPKSILRLNATTTAIKVAVTQEDDAADCIIRDMQIDGNRANITPGVDLYNNFFLVRGARNGRRLAFVNLILSNSWGRVLQTSDETVADYAEDVLVDNVRVTNAGTKAISATRSRRVTVSNCFAEVAPYVAADHPGGVGDGNAASGSCFEVSKSQVVTLSNCHGRQIGATINAPGFRFINSSSDISCFGGSIEGATYLGFIQNVNSVRFFGNKGKSLTENGFLVTDSDPGEGTCVGIRIFGNSITDSDVAMVIASAIKSGADAFTEVFVYDNEFSGATPGGPAQGIRNNGVTSPATGGFCRVYEWNNDFQNVQQPRSGVFAGEIRGQPRSGGWEVIAQSSVAVSHTGATGEETLATIPIPAGEMGRNGRVRVTAFWSYTNSANNKTTRIRFGGSQVYASVNTTTTALRAQIEVGNRNSEGGQVATTNGGVSGFGTQSSAVTTLSIDTTALVNIGITGQLADAGETIRLESYVVELFNAY